jgi:hypothetical protein
MFLIDSKMANRKVYKDAVNAVCIAVPALLAFVGHALEVQDGDSKNAELNIARHAFSCTMR